MSVQLFDRLGIIVRVAAGTVAFESDNPDGDNWYFTAEDAESLGEALLYAAEVLRGQAADAAYDNLTPEQLHAPGGPHS